MKKIGTDHLFHLMQTAYPGKMWYLEEYTSNGEARHAILFSHDDIAIHNPMVSDCGRFAQPDFFGLSEEHARILRRHNRGYEDHLTGGTVDLKAVFDRVVEATRAQPPVCAETFLDDLGFALHETGPGQIAYALFDAEQNYLYVTDPSGSTVPAQLENLWVRLFDANKQLILDRFT